jgi:signal peptide peptidase SppA
MTMKTDFAKGAAWAIVPERFDELMRIYHETDVTPKQAEQIVTIGERWDERVLYRVTDEGIAIVPIQGPLVKGADWFDRLLGMADYLDVQTAVREAAADPRVAGIVLDIDSPGGTVNGADETAELIFAARGKLPVIAYSSGMMASAAYLIGSAAGKIVIGKNAEVGSIGVLMIHRDWSKAEERIGVKTTYLRAGRYKALGNPSEPLSEEAREVFQAELNHIYENFIETVALHRDVEAEKVRADMAEGRVFIGVKAVGAGLADEVANMDTALGYAMGAETNQNDRRTTQMKAIETYEQLKAAAPEILKAAEDTAREDGVKSVDLGPATKEAAEAERARILGMAEVHFGEDAGAKFKALVESGISVEQYKATVAAIGKPEPDKSAEEEAKKAALEALKAAGAPNPGAGDPPAGGKDYMTLVDEYRAQHKCTKTEAMMAVNRSHPAARQEYIQKNNPGLAVAK